MLFSCASRQNEEVPQVQEKTVQTDTVESGYGFNPDSLAVVEGKVRNGQYFSSLLTGLGMSQKEAYDLTLACGQVFDVKTLRVGQP